MHSRFSVALLVAVVLASAACGGVVDPSNNKTDTFTGTLTIGGSDIKTFNVSSSGEYTVTITNLNPSISAFFYTEFDQNVSGSCVPQQQNPQSSVGFEALSGAIIPGSYCVQIADIYSALKQTTMYTLTVSHP